MQLIDVSYHAGTQRWLERLNLTLAPSTINILLGATLAGKTTLMRIMAGLQPPSSGQVTIADRDVTGVPVRKRNVAMVYQQFINYPSMTVYENIASPLRIAGLKKDTIHARVTAIADTLQLTPFLDRLPSALSGGQQQRTALARALAKDAELVLLDEPLVNLDYKLREQLRGELRSMFSTGRSTVVYATTEPQEALQLGGHTTVLVEGRIAQHGPTSEVFRRPATLEAARAFSDPPLNELAAEVEDNGLNAQLSAGLRMPLPHRVSAKRLLLAARAHHFSLTSHPGWIEITGRIELAEISGSETYIHLSREQQSIIAQLAGVHRYNVGDMCTLYVDPANFFGFDERGQLLFAP